MITGGKTNNTFNGTVVYQAAWNTSNTSLQGVVDKLVKQYPFATIVGIIGKLESGNEIFFHWNA